MWTECATESGPPSISQANIDQRDETYDA